MLAQAAKGKARRVGNRGTGQGPKLSASDFKKVFFVWDTRRRRKCSNCRKHGWVCDYARADSLGCTRCLAMEPGHGECSWVASEYHTCDVPGVN